MSEIINVFDNKKLREELKQKDQEIIDLSAKLLKYESITDIIILQIYDIKDNFKLIENNLGTISKNLTNLQEKLIKLKENDNSDRTN